MTDLNAGITLVATICQIIIVQLVLLTTFESMILIRDTHAIENRQQLKARKQQRKKIFKMIIIGLVVMNILQFGLLFYFEAKA